MSDKERKEYLKRARKQCDCSASLFKKLGEDYIDGKIEESDLYALSKQIGYPINGEGKFALMELFVMDTIDLSSLSKKKKKGKALA